MTPVRLEPAALRSRVKRSTTALPISSLILFIKENIFEMLFSAILESAQSDSRK